MRDLSPLSVLVAVTCYRGTLSQTIGTSINTATLRFDQFECSDNLPYTLHFAYFRLLVSNRTDTFVIIQRN